jgi:cytochrome c553
MKEEQLYTVRNPWFTASVLTTGGIALIGAIVGFVWLPGFQGNHGIAGLWDTICRAAGVVRTSPSQPVVQTTYRTSSVVVTPGMLRHASAESIGRGATLALRCTMCHGARGLSEANTPNLAGQYPAVLYKQLLDYKSGARTSVVMAPLVAALTDQDVRDLSAYYAYLPRLPPFHPVVAGTPPLIVIDGAPMRNIAPCGSCHGSLANKTGSAWLEGQPEAYLRVQLQAFASGARRNDISEQMRNVARNMTPAEIEEASRYYASQPGDDGSRSRSVP